MTSCIFCNIESERIIDETNLFVVIRDIFPVTSLHTLIIPKRHVASYFELNSDELNEMQTLLKAHKERISEKDGSESAFNIGINIGEDAGQTIFHCHIHLIPRRKSDTENPRGGVRGVIKEKQQY